MVGIKYLYEDTRGNALKTKWSPCYFWSSPYTVNYYHWTFITLLAAMVKTPKTIQGKRSCKIANLSTKPWLFSLVSLYLPSISFLKTFYPYSMTKSTWILPLNININKLGKMIIFFFIIQFMGTPSSSCFVSKPYGHLWFLSWPPILSINKILSYHTSTNPLHQQKLLVLTLKHKTWLITSFTAPPYCELSSSLT